MKRTLLFFLTAICILFTEISISVSASGYDSDHVNKSNEDTSTLAEPIAGNTHQVVSSTSGSCGDNATWTLDDGVLTISGSGEIPSYNLYEENPWYDIRSAIKHIEIMEGITAIGDRVFAECENLVSISFSDSVITIGDICQSCNSLTTVTLPENVTRFGGMSNCENLVEVILPDNLVYLGGFSGCTNLLNLSIPDSVTVMGGGFWECASLTSIKLPENLVCINETMFAFCSNLREVIIPDGVTSIGTYAFWNCSKLENVKLPKCLTSIGYNAFSGCSSLTSMVIPSGVRVIEDGGLFHNCDNLSSVIMEYGIRRLPGAAFSGDRGLRTIVLPDSVTQIGVKTFFECYSLTSVTMPEYLSEINEDAFYDCRSLTSITIPAGVTSIGPQAFACCSNLEEIIFCGDAPYIQDDAFYKCSATAYYPSNNKTWTDDIMQSYEGNITWVSYDPCDHVYAVNKVVNATCTDAGFTRYVCTLCENVHTEYTDLLSHQYENDVCIFCGFVRRVMDTGKCGDNVTWKMYSDGLLVLSGYGEMAEYFDEDFWHPYRGIIRSVVIEDGITDIIENAFLDCTMLSDVMIPDSVATIRDSAFNGCVSLLSVNIPDSVTSIESSAFAGCISLTDVVLPDGLQSIEYGVFSGCHNLVCINLPSKLTYIGEAAFNDCRSLPNIVLPTSVTNIGSGAFSGCDSFTRIEIPENVSSLKSTFGGCNALQEVILPKGLLEIGDGTFGSCSSLIKLDIPDSVAIIGNQAFYFCKELTELLIPDSVQFIGFEAFSGCYELKHVEIPYGVQAILPYTFAYCYNLESIRIPVTVRSIQSEAFQKSEEIKNVYYTGSKEQWNNITFFKNNYIENKNIHFLATEKYDNTIIENEIQFAQGQKDDYIDRLLLPDAGQEFYDWLEESTDGDGIDDELIIDDNGYIGVSYTYTCKFPISSDSTYDLLVKLGREEQALCNTILTVYSLFIREHPELYFFDSSTVSYGYSREMTSDTEGYVFMELDLGARAIDVEEYSAAYTLKNRVVAEVISAIPEATSDYEKIRYFNAYLTKNNCYNSDYPDEPDPAHWALTALVGNVGSDGPVCDAYARAFKILCDTQNIPCSIVYGTADNESHAWNRVQMEDGNWYDVDITWNDPTVDGISDAVSGYEREAYLLVGKRTIIDGTSYYESRKENILRYEPLTGLPIPEVPSLSEMEYVPDEVEAHIVVYDLSTAVKPTCTESGLLGKTYCYLCGVSFSEPKVTPALGHTEEVIPGYAAKCANDGLTDGVKCSVCNAVLREQVKIQAKGHQYDKYVTEPSCLSDGYATYICKECNHLYIGDFVDAYGHTSVYVPSVAATCLKSGLSYGQYCSVCNEVLVEQAMIPPTGHKAVIDNEVAATCTSTGLTEGQHCSSCGDVLVPQEKVDALGHNWTAATCEKAKTCTACGKTEGSPVGHDWNAATCETPKTCTVCAKTEGKAKGHSWNNATCDKPKTCTVCRKTEGAALGHNWNNATCDKAKTCASCGKTEGTALGHKWNAATCDKAKTCAACGKTEGAALGHKWTAATCTTPKTCASCGKTEGSVKDHSWDAGTVTKPATETAEGLKTFKCTACGETKTEKIPVLSHTHKYTDKVTAPTCITEGYTTHTCACGHSYTDSKVPATGHKNAKDAAIAATCTKEGLTEGSHCSVCGTVIQKQQTVPAKGHSWDKGTVTKPATETAEGVLTYKCTSCSESRTESIPMLDHVHKYTDKIVAPTCTAEGYTIHTCVCGHSYTDSQVPAKGHAWDKGTVTKEPTEISEGVKTFKCTACGETKSESIPVLDHVHKYESVVVAPTCISEGYTNHTCVCGHSYTDSKVPATGHKPVKDAAVAATCTKEGLTEGSRCSVCAVVLKAQEAVPAKGHAWDKGTVTKEPTENAEGVKTFKCASCGETRTESIPALGHTHKYESKVVVPTCTAEGYTTHTCACGHSYTDSKVPATGHKPVKDAAVAATCTKEGLTEGSHCSVCAVVLTSQQPVPAKGHAWDNGTVTKEPTENAEGVKTYKCASCGETRTESIPALGHTHKYDSKVVAPTCTAEGYTTHTCACGHSYTDSKVPAKGHAWDNGSVTKEPTENAEGVKTFQCASCGETRTESIPALGHTHKYENGVCVGCGEVQILASGTIGKYITWKLDAKGVLTISGTGLVELILEKIFPRTMGDVILVNNAPWMSYAEKIQKVVVEEGVTGLGEGAFLGCTALEEVTVAGSVTDLGAYTFADCDALKIVTVEGAAPAIGENCFRNVEGCIVHPANDETWTEDILAAAGGKMTLTTQRPDAPAIKPGDVNGDGKADYSDALKILRASIGLETLTEELKAAADVNGDGKADYSDALKILRASIGLETL